MSITRAIGTQSYYGHIPTVKSYFDFGQHRHTEVTQLSSYPYLGQIISKFWGDFKTAIRV